LLLGVGLNLPVVATAYAQTATEPAQKDDEPVELGSIIVVGSAEAQVSKTGTALLDVPQNIQVLSGQLLQEQGVSVLEDGLRNVAGVSVGGYARAYDFFRIRGFEAWQYTQLDGLPRTVSLNIEPNALEQVEVIKGPASVLYGRGAPGGVVNLVSKRPQSMTFADVSVTGGSFDTFIGTADLNKVFDPDGEVAGRLNLVYRREGSHIDDTKGVERLYVGPALRWVYSDVGDITFLASVTRERNELVPAQPATGYILYNPNGRLSRSLFIEDPDNPPTIDQKHITAGYEWNTRFTDALRFQQNLRFTWTDLDWYNIYQPLSLSEDQRTLTLYTADLIEKRHAFGVDSRVMGSFGTGAVTHAVTLGHEFRDESVDRVDYLGGFYPGVQFDLFNPDYSVFVRPEMTAYPSTSDSRSNGLYLQDEISVFERTTVTLGGRYDRVSVDSGTGGVNYDAFVPRVGVNHRITPVLAAYVSYSESFNPQVGLRDANGNAVEPERGDQYEVGLKLATTDGRYNLTAAVYDLTRTNVATARVTPPGTYDVTGRQRSKGFELDAQLRPLPGLQLIASYAYTDAKVLEDNVQAVGSRPLNSPKQTTSLWAKYTFQEGTLAGLGLSLGGSHYSDQAGDAANSFFLPSYTLLNANVSYDIGGRTWLQLNISNLTDEYAAVGSLSPLYVTYATPRAFRFTIGHRF
jgi:iron complex outermembrane receptor protein